MSVHVTELMLRTTLCQNMSVYPCMGPSMHIENFCTDTIFLQNHMDCGVKLADILLMVLFVS